jgi:osmotically-inducible protein OsmY
MRWANGLCLLLALGGTAWAQGRRELSDPPSRAEGAGPPDEERARSIEATLASDPSLRDDQIAIQVNGKNVRLTGHVDNPEERARAQELVEQSDPTLTVENLLQSDEHRVQTTPGTTTNTLSDDTKRAAHKVEKAAGDVGAMASDGWITSKVKSQLLAADGVHASAINVDTTDHVVTLKGRVRSQAERKKAMSIAQHTHGVERVVDQLALTR